MKAMKVLLKISGCVFFLLGAACLIAGFLDEIRKLLPSRRRRSEFDDYAD